MWASRMVPNPVNLATALSDLIPMVMPSLVPVYENSFASPEGSLWAADLWTPQSSTVSFRTTSDQSRHGTPSRCCPSSFPA